MKDIFDRIRNFFIVVVGCFSKVFVKQKQQEWLTTFFCRRKILLGHILTTILLFFWHSTVFSQNLEKVTLKRDAQRQQVLHLHFSEPLKALPQHFKIAQPDRLVLDFDAVHAKMKPAELPLSQGVFSRLRFLETNERLRVVVDLNKQVNDQLEIKGQELWITLSSKKQGDVKFSNEIKEVLSLQGSQPLSSSKIIKLDFHRSTKGGGQLNLLLEKTNTPTDIKTKGQDIILTFPNTQLSNSMQRILDVSDFKTPVKQLTSFMEKNDTKIVIKNEGHYDYYAYQIDKNFVLEIFPLKATEKESKESGSRPGYSGEKITLNFQDIKVRAVLQLLAEFTGINIVASDNIKGSTTLHLHQVPWDEVMDIILRTQGLAKKQMGNVILVAPIEEMAMREKQELQSSQEVSDLSPIGSELIPIRYATALDIANLLKDDKNSLLSSRGHLSTDTRTNTLWVQDTAQKILEVRNMIDKLDRPVKQVLIEARIVNVQRNFEKNLGIRFGIYKPPHWAGTLDGANQTATGSTIGSVAVSQRLNMDFRANPTSGNSPGSIGVALANLGKGYLLDLELSALEEEGGGNIISSPRIMTADQQTASIESGEEIPYQESTSSGATNVAFKKAVLSLKVTPHITPDNKLVMDLEVHQDTKGEVISGVPAINTQQIQTRVLVDSAETIVLGGIYQQTRSSAVERIPLLSSLPVLGRLFSNNQDINNRNELIIFVTPKIIDNVVTEP